jgi:hypothetical protein
VFAKKRISNSLQLAIGGFDSAFALAAFVSNWATHADLTKQNYERRQLSRCAMFNGGFAAGNAARRA